MNKHYQLQLFTTAHHYSIVAKARNAQEIYGGASGDGFLESEIFLKLKKHDN